MSRARVTGCPFAAMCRAMAQVSCAEDKRPYMLRAIRVCVAGKARRCFPVFAVLARFK